LEGAIYGVEESLLVEFLLVLIVVKVEGGLVGIHLLIGGNRVVRMPLVEGVEKGVGFKGIPCRGVGMGLDLGDPSIDGVELGREGLDGAKNGGKGGVQRRRQGGSRSGLRGRALWGSQGRAGVREARAARGGVCGRRVGWEGEDIVLSVSLHIFGLTAAIAGEGRGSKI